MCKLIMARSFSLARLFAELLAHGKLTEADVPERLRGKALRMQRTTPCRLSEFQPTPTNQTHEGTNVEEDVLVVDDTSLDLHAMPLPDVAMEQGHEATSFTMRVKRSLLQELPRHDQAFATYYETVEFDAEEALNASNAAQGIILPANFEALPPTELQTDEESPPDPKEAYPAAVDAYGCPVHEG
jgi:hypothetical protein